MGLDVSWILDSGVFARRCAIKTINCTFKRQEVFMRKICFLACLWLSQYVAAQSNLQLYGLNQAVEVVRDNWGVNHIYAKNEHDLFFAQGYLAAKDRLFQFEMWRRQATGTMAELMGDSALKRDIGAWLFSYRGDMEKELAH
jgi:penicillin amidase